jgi:predicted ATPase
MRSALAGEPSRALANWLAGQCGGLPARAVGELARLRERGGLVPTDDGGWTIKPMMLARPRRRTRLPVPMTRLIGRQQERAAVGRMLDGHRLITLAGPGGIGKTRLSLSVAAACADGFDDGVVFVPLAEVTGNDPVVAAIARALGVGEVPGQSLLDSVIDHLADARLLLVLDNFEQVVGAAGVIGDLLAVAPGISALVTSRERLSLPGEQVYQVPPLPLPSPDRLLAGADGLAGIVAESPALALFEERARAANVDFTLSPATLPAVVALCRRLDGLPLAIELAAARTDRWDPQALLDDLSHHLDALGDGPRDLPPRQQTLRGAIDWSFALLGEDDQRLFARLAVFAGGCTVDSALAVADDATGTDGTGTDGTGTDGTGTDGTGTDGTGTGSTGTGGRRETLAVRMAALVDKSLLTTESDPDGATRYRMLETIRAYAATRLDAEPRAAAVYARHATHCAAFAGSAGMGLTGPDQADWGGRLDREYQNLRAALGWATAHGEIDTAARICLGVWRFWHNGNHIGEGRDWLGQVLVAPGDLGDRVRAQLLHAGAALAARQDEHEPAYRLAADSLRHAEAADDRQLSAQARNLLGIAAVVSGAYHLATNHFQQCLQIWRDLGRPEGAAVALGNLTKATLRLGDIDAASRYADEVLKLERAAGNTRGILLGLECQAQILLARDEVAAARTVLKESLELSRTLGDGLGEAMALHQLGLAAQRDGEPAEALRLLADALGRRHEEEDREDLATSMDSVANVVVATHPPLAARLLGAADGLRTRHRLPDPPESETRRGATLAAARDGLGADAFAAAWEAGRTAPLDLVVDQALDTVPG